MPQTREHLEILQILHTKKGVIAITKADMVDEEEAISGQHSAVDQNQHQEPFTTEGTEEKGGLPQMNADKRRWEREEIATIVMKPIPTKDLGLTLGQTHAKMG